MLDLNGNFLLFYRDIYKKLLGDKMEIKFKIISKKHLILLKRENVKMKTY